MPESSANPADCRAILPAPVRFRRCSARPAGRGGLTLVEVMLGLTIAGTAALGGLAGMLFCLRMADSNLRALTAASAVRSVGEQLLTIDYASLFAADLPVDVPSNPGGSLQTNVWNTRVDDPNETPANPNDDLQMRIRPTITRIHDADGLDYAQVVISYEWIDSSYFVPRTRSDSLTMIVAPVSSF